MGNTEVRRARAEDRDAVLAFCAHTWEWGDYIEYVWDEWLHDSQGTLFVATVDGQPVGIGHIRMLNATDAWLEGMRVAPGYRNHGIATVLNQTMVADAMQRGATVARLLTESTNLASIHMVEEHFWNRIGSFASFAAEPIAVPATQLDVSEMPQLATEEDIDDIIDYLNASNIFPLTGGLYYHAFTAYLISGDLLAEKIAAHQVYMLRRWDRLDGIALVEPREGRQRIDLSIGYIDGTTESISLLAYVLRRTAREMEVDRVYAYVPDMMMVRDAFAGAEYDWDEKVFYTYERGLI